jgi:hypothetical protein
LCPVYERKKIITAYYYTRDIEKKQKTAIKAEKTGNSGKTI